MPTNLVSLAIQDHEKEHTPTIELKEDEVVPHLEESSLEEESTMEKSCDTDLEESMKGCDEVDNAEAIQHAVDNEDLPHEIIPRTLSILSYDWKTNHFEEGESDMNPVDLIPIIQVPLKGVIHSCILED